LRSRNVSNMLPDPAQNQTSYSYFTRTIPSYSSHKILFKACHML